MKNNTSNIVLPNFSESPRIDKVGVEERVAKFQKRSIKSETKIQGLKMALSMIDLTTLEGKDTPGKVKQMCYKAQHVHDVFSELPKVAAVCVYPSMVDVAVKAVAGSGVKVASVSTAFPSGQAPLAVKLADTKFAVSKGADEIDMVISRGKFLSGEYNFVFDEIAAIKEACGKARLKVILETGELVTLDNVRRASDIAMYAGADFIKTSTGKIQPAATMQVTYVMLEAIRDFMDTTGIKVGMKPAGGISNSKLALHNLVMVNEVLGAGWLNNGWFRFGASSLANDVLMQIVKAETGVYQSSNYFSID
ncbi:MAG: deoxyribose-phosphate aldolase [Crocinitomicaceae bacterium]|nr:deoxyribose-phosphate aldolase [Crocinitomicaceae bacterium]MDG1776589.1 deoxyribose-phosphate aldolase [Crocinitomicaceae bacterium]